MPGLAGEEVNVIATGRGHRLTPKEYEVLSLLAEGYSNWGIAERLGIGEETVKKHVQVIYAKLGVGIGHENGRWNPRVQAAVVRLYGVGNMYQGA